ncbi:carbohydrate ABC transporter permease [Cellulomonas sp. DKR-3]|uniref:Carbohydrate ABC transporter permease n=1 Tax=Cellulomonas fulva TaxID=2835530 RepID=A0ABS5TXG1_9CELL|nr:carbohydrate ABC transporter permease [Cellulomonas fulva]MBT0993842.1 carbohydrate ABC transporter permease [Cellulomonas fulva]
MNRRYTGRTFATEVGMVVVALVIAFPLYILVNLAFRDRSSQQSLLTPTSDPTWANFSTAWNDADLGKALLTSTFVTVVSVVIIVAVSALAAYVLARVTKRWSRLMFALFMVGLLLPFQLALLPLYSTIRDLGLIGSVWSLILFYSGLQVPFATFLYTGFLRALPLDYEEAAMLDGCSPLRAFTRVVFPLLRPITGTVIILNAVFVWNDFLTPLLYLSGSTTATMPLAISTFVAQYSSNYNVVFAGLLIGIIPVLVVYFAMQRSIIKGFSGGLKA